MLLFTAVLLLLSSFTSSDYLNVNALNVDTITSQTTTVKTYYPEPTTTLAPEWGQCGGIGWLGTTTCTFGTACVSINEWYSQCQKVTSTISMSTVPTSSFPCPTLVAARDVSALQQLQLPSSHAPHTRVLHAHPAHTPHKPLRGQRVLRALVLHIQLQLRPNVPLPIASVVPDAQRYGRH
ncbi:hypothetical protein BDQ17DRAFT_1544109 [Cyathus striatus]|nr:hypothetical protein BDQ17DRAFT_1544109 [Cyathus striatus]